MRNNRQPECLASARAERANVDVALSWCAANDPLLGARIAIGFGWTWVVLGDGPAGAARVRQALTAETPARERATLALLAGWLDASAGNLALAQDDLDGAADLATELGDEVLVADVERHRAFLAIQQGRPNLVLAHAAASLATYRPLDLKWRIAASPVLPAYGSLMVGETQTATREATAAVGALAPIGDSWGWCTPRPCWAGPYAICAPSALPLSGRDMGGGVTRVTPGSQSAVAARCGYDLDSCGAAAGVGETSHTLARIGELPLMGSLGVCGSTRLRFALSGPYGG